MPFDPCREWLGIDATDLKDPHRVLGIPPSETDGDRIAQLAAERLAGLATIAPGPFGKAHTAIMTRVAEARDTLLATATWETTLEPVAEEPVFSPPPPPTLSAPPPPTIPLFVPAPIPDVPTALVQAANTGVKKLESLTPPVFSPDTESSEHDVPQVHATLIPPASETTRAAPIRRSQSSKGGAGLGLFAFFLAGTIAAGYYAYKKFGVAQNGLDVAIRSMIEPLRGPSTVAQIPPSSTPNGSPPIVAEPTASPAQPPRVTDPAPPEPAPVSPPTPPQTPAPPVVPPPDPAAERRLAAERARAVEAVNTSLQEAFRALQREEFDTADRVIEAASKQVGDDVAAATRIERWRLAAAYARAYGGYRDQAFKSANAGREYEIDGKRIAIIEITPTEFTYRLAGRNKTVSRKAMSPVLEIGVVEDWFSADGRASNYLFIGSRWLCKDPPNHERARAAWRKAANGGENVAPLMALLDDPITQRRDGP